MHSQCAIIEIYLTLKNLAISQFYDVLKFNFSALNPLVIT
jgi:hypothetical protein